MSNTLQTLQVTIKDTSIHVGFYQTAAQLLTYFQIEN